LRLVSVLAADNDMTKMSNNRQKRQGMRQMDGEFSTGIDPYTLQFSPLWAASFSSAASPLSQAISDPNPLSGFLYKLQEWET